MDLMVLLPEVLGRRPDMSGETRRVTDLLRKAARRFCRETGILKLTNTLTLSSGLFDVGPYGDSILKSAPLDPPAGQTWEAGVTLTPVRWLAVTMRPTTGTVRPSILEPMPTPIYDAWLLAKSAGKSALSGDPVAFTDRLGVLCLAPGWVAGTFDQMVVQVTAEPSGDFNLLPGLTNEAEEGILSLALADVFEYPGAGSNPALAKMYLDRASAIGARLYAKALTGQAEGLAGFQLGG